MSDFANKRLVQEQFLKREYNISHLSVEKEFAFYNAVKDGDLEMVEEIMLPLQNQQLGKLSDNKLRNLKYHLIITIAFITRFCIEGGMLGEDAYSLSDIYIQQLDKISDEDEINELHKRIVIEYTKKMKSLKRKSPFSKTVTEIMDYIYDHLHEKICLTDIAECLNKDKTYLCKLFKEETGISIGDYTTQRKIEAAQNMLKYSDFSYIEISNYLGFTTHSHFISTFKKMTGLTPKQYKDHSFRQELSS